MRIIKSQEEIQKIEAAQRIAEAAFQKLITAIRPGMTEKQVASVLDFYMMDLGADGISFDTIAASGMQYPQTSHCRAASSSLSTSVP